MNRRGFLTAVVVAPFVKPIADSRSQNSLTKYESWPASPTVEDLLAKIAGKTRYDYDSGEYKDV